MAGLLAALVILAALWPRSPYGPGGGWPAPPPPPGGSLIETSRGRVAVPAAFVPAADETAPPSAAPSPSGPAPGAAPDPVATSEPTGGGTGGGGTGGGTGGGSGPGAGGPQPSPPPRSAATPPAEGVARLRGIVVDDATGSPVPGVCVLTGNERCTPDRPRTDDEGRWVIEVLSGATWEITFVHEQYSSAHLRVVPGNPGEHFVGITRLLR